MRAAAVLLFAHAAAADIQASWTGVTIASDLTFDASAGDCKISGSGGAVADGSCTLSWGTNYTGTLKGSKTNDIAGGTFSANLKIDGLIGFKPSCPICGTGNCTLKIPIVGTTVGIPLSPCPIAGGSIDNTTVIPVPAAPAGLPKTTVKGTFTVVDDQSANLGKGSVTATIAA